MKKLGIILVLISLGVLLGCGSKNTEPIPVEVGISPTTANVVAGRAQQFAAQVSGSNNTAVTWTVTGSGCTGAACGTVSTSGLYTAPATIPNPAAVTVTATSQADATKSASAVVTVVVPPPVSVSVTPKSPSVLVATSLTFAATVANTTNGAVTWTLSGAGCSGAACGTLSNGVYTAPPTVPNPATVTVTATSQADNSKAASATVTIVATPNELLTGSYAFLFHGFDANGAFAEIGYFSFTGTGTVGGQSYMQHASGSNTGGGLISSGSYTVGADYRVQLNVTWWPSATRTFQFAYGASGEINFIEFDYSGTHGAGVMKKQEQTGFSGHYPLSGDFVLALQGADSGSSRVGLVGRIHLDNTGALTGAYDINKAGANATGTLSGNYTVFDGGDCQAQMLGIGRTINWRFLFVNRSEMFWIIDGTTDSAYPLLAGVARQQSGGPFSNPAASGNLVLALTGKGAGGTTLELARVTADESGTLTSGQFDLNDGGTISSAASTSPAGNYTVTADGRGTLGLQFAQKSQGGQQFVFYVVQPGDLYVLQTGGTQTLTGTAVAQTGPLTMASLDGRYGFGPLEAAWATAKVRTGSANLYENNSVLTGVVDTDSGTGLSMAQSLSGVMHDPDATGRALVTLSSPTNSTFVLYAVSPGKFMLLPDDQGTTWDSIWVFSW